MKIVAIKIGDGWFGAEAYKEIVMIQFKNKFEVSPLREKTRSYLVCKYLLK